VGWRYLKAEGRGEETGGGGRIWWVKARGGVEWGEEAKESDRRGFGVGGGKRRGRGGDGTGWEGEGVGI